MSNDYSVWLVPDSESTAYQEFDEAIANYAESYEDACEFEPHVTIVGGVGGERADLVNKTRNLAHRQDPFTISFTQVQCSTTRHQCVFVLVEPTLELLYLYQRATQAFEMSEEMYVPHLSLIYSDMGIDQRLKIVKSIRTMALPDETQVDSIALVETTGPASDWKTITTFELGK